jgi:hypothetical protein
MQFALMLGLLLRRPPSQPELQVRHTVRRHLQISLQKVLRNIGGGKVNEANYFVCRCRRRNSGLVVEKR